MNWDVLLHWMTHLREGSWGSFRGAVAKLADADADIDDLCRRLRIALSDLGHAGFFVDDSQRWRVLPPVLAGLPPPSEAAVLAGGRTPKLSAALADAAATRGCRVVAEGVEDRPACVRLEGPPNALGSAAADAGLQYIENFAVHLCASIRPIPPQLETARVEEAPGNWSVHSFDIESLKWVEGLRSRSACEFRPRYGRSRFYVHTRRGRLLRLDRREGGKREAVYAAAMIREVPLADYDTSTAMLSVPASAPFPESFARAACLCTGVPAAFNQGRLVYRNVPRDIAAVLLIAAGQPYPEAHQPASTAVGDAGQPHGQPV